MFNRFKISLALCAFVSIPVIASTQATGVVDADAKEIQTYRLTIPALNKVVQATKNLFEAAKNDPRFQKQAALEAEIEKLEAKEEPTEADEARIEKLRAEVEQLEDSLNFADNTQTLSEMAAAVEREPMAAKALASAGISAREYAKFMLAYFQAGMVAGMMKQGVIKEVPKELAGTLNMDNVKFVQEHEAEFEAFDNAMKAINKK